MGLNVKNKNDQPKLVKCVCKKCRRVFKSYVEVDLCDKCQREEDSKKSSADLLFDFDF